MTLTPISPSLCGLVSGSLLVALLLGGCASNPTGGANFVLMSENRELEIGKEEHEKLMKSSQVYQDARLQAYVDQIGKKLAAISHRPDLEYHFTIIDSPDINAFALPGAYVYVNRGLIDYLTTEAQLAAVLGHEIAHVVLNHSQQRVNQATGVALGTVLLDTVLSANGADKSTRAVAATGAAAAGTVGLILPYSRKAELQSDQLGTLYMARAGYNPEESIKLWERFSAWRIKKGESESPEFLRTHPLDQSRILALKSFLPTAQREYKPR